MTDALFNIGPEEEEPAQSTGPGEHPIRDEQVAAIREAFTTAGIDSQERRQEIAQSINDGEHVTVLEISTGASLLVILGVLTVTVLASIFSPKGKAKNAVSGAKRHAVDYLDLNYETDIVERERIFTKMVSEEEQLRTLPEKYKRLIRHETEVRDLLHRAHAEHDKALQREEQR